MHWEDEYEGIHLLFILYAQMTNICLVTVGNWKLWTDDQPFLYVLWWVVKCLVEKPLGRQRFGRHR